MFRYTTLNNIFMTLFTYIVFARFRVFFHIFLMIFLKFREVVWILHMKL